MDFLPNMRQLTHQLAIQTSGRRIYDITRQVRDWVAAAGIATGLLTLFIQHTSASLLVNENYDPDV